MTRKTIALAFAILLSTGCGEREMGTVGSEPVAKAEPKAPDVRLNATDARGTAYFTWMDRNSR